MSSNMSPRAQTYLRFALVFNALEEHRFRDGDRELNQRNAWPSASVEREAHKLRKQLASGRVKLDPAQVSEALGKLEDALAKATDEDTPPDVVSQREEAFIALARAQQHLRNHIPST
jgi:hypothetical protein